MRSSQKKRETRRVFDVQFRAWFGAAPLNLRPKFRVRHPWVTVLLIIFGVALGVIGLRRVFVRAEVVDFYPASCLGTWQSPDRAQGKPESLSGAPIDATSSAAWGDVTQQIFCGSFVPPGTAEAGDIKSVGLTLIWDIAGLPVPAVATSTATSTSFSAPFSPLAFFIQSARAQDMADPAAPADTPTDTPTDVPLDETSTVIIGPPVLAPLAPMATSSTPDTPTDTSTTDVLVPAVLGVSTSTVPTSPAPDDSFLLISYSTDGNSWVPLQKVNPRNWQNLTLSLPLNSWSDLEKLQMKIEGISTSLTVLPKILLDGMLVEAHYDLPPVFVQAGLGDASNTDAQVVHATPNITIEIPAQEPVPFVPPPTVVSIDKSASGVSVTVQYVGDFYDGNPLYLFMYPHGTTAERNGSDASFTFAQSPGAVAVNPLPVGGGALDPTTKQATVVLVAVSPDGYQAALSDMVSGAYDVDIAYYDTDSWHLTPPTAFTWP